MYDMPIEGKPGCACFSLKQARSGLHELFVAYRLSIFCVITVLSISTIHWQSIKFHSISQDERDNEMINNDAVSKDSVISLVNLSGLSV